MNVRLGRWSQILAPHYSFCQRCGTPWRFVKERTIPFYDHTGKFAMCEKCWDECSLYERVQHFQSARVMYWPYTTPDEVWEAVYNETKREQEA